MNDDLKKELHNAKMEEWSLLELLKTEYDNNIRLHVSKNWSELSLSSSKLAVIYHKLDVVTKRIDELMIEYTKELFE